MKISGNDLGLAKLGLLDLTNVHRNISVESMVTDIVGNGEGVIGLRGAAMVDTGIYTGRSPNDKYIVDEPSSTEKIWWGPVNRKVSEKVFDGLYNKVVNYYNRSDDSKTYIFDGFAGADPTYSLNVRIIAKKAWQAHFVHNMFIRPEDGELDDFNPEFTIINASDVSNKDFKSLGMNSETFILFHLGRRIAIIGGTEYGGEMKKGIFSVLHYLLPQRGVLSMHCSANVYVDGGNPAIFFGLSGTGKTTLSTDPVRPLIGDDEHGWSDDGIFNFEGGCYAKVINLNKDEEPDIYNAIREGALLENVVYNEETKVIDFTDGSKTENTRVSYPLNHIDNSVYGQGKSSVAGHPEKIIFLTCDAYGVLPPVAKLSSDQAMYHFISGYTAKVAGTERGITEPTATFSPCFGGPFLTLHPLRYAELLKEKMEKFDVDVYLVNTGWVGANAKSGAKRFNLPKTREIINSILGGEIEKSEFETDSYFGFQIPISLGEIDSNLLNPVRAWDNLDEYHTTAKELVQKFQANYKQYDLGDTAVLNAGPSL
ncbi:MAG: phosphoenolpyruvate carboxykinase (ATP) [Candidatus Marinimicrobia bacterium]|jgi:phosphoenolpyruvate carboxykinase (ATP)|nr:phosphoenolpyruvate carboxykinase (ATP) [Candidatus Neomarinimicrobiota bacterium]MBT3848307.1 phosphoenolpyruvate carboxykinase (ATP) [Candidatus Neomarinimicrobiota bacterium]MBT4054758.1 phosphoenolpyruvate carboxykinase (ATP) [Candidatus Neomarinimicrobiota bacterium]MBT4663184.1 phosphoenolpyruvate carboxykinase (ATP) [Candidatus Neomarinimicrobiota bacterium]MBT4827575.1 phosphoenolpyruvate carboxykinase (ATP) [Candidatus Neomarinimicrobiota bacterium]